MGERKKIRASLEKFFKIERDFSLIEEGDIIDFPRSEELVVCKCSHSSSSDYIQTVSRESEYSVNEYRYISSKEHERVNIYEKYLKRTVYSGGCGSLDFIDFTVLDRKLRDVGL